MGGGESLLPFAQPELESGRDDIVATNSVNLDTAEQPEGQLTKTGAGLRQGVTIRLGPRSQLLASTPWWPVGHVAPLHGRWTSVHGYLILTQPLPPSSSSAGRQEQGETSQGGDDTCPLAAGAGLLRSVWATLGPSSCGRRWMRPKTPSTAVKRRKRRSDGGQCHTRRARLRLSAPGSETCKGGLLSA